MNFTVKVNSKEYIVNINKPISLAIKQNFNQQQPNFFQAPKAKHVPLKTNTFIGDINRGASCNVSHIELTPHCNGTHTETVNHIRKDSVLDVHQATMEGLIPAIIISVKSYAKKVGERDLIITKESIAKFLSHKILPESFALIIRTYPNEQDKLNKNYTEKNNIPFFSLEAIKYINTLPIKHLLVDMPSIDRIYDSKTMPNHHAFWESDETKTITELIYVDKKIKDGLYLLNLQVPAFTLESAPSRPIIYSLKVI